MLEKLEGINLEHDVLSFYIIYNILNAFAISSEQKNVLFSSIKHVSLLNTVVSFLNNLFIVKPYGFPTTSFKKTSRLNKNLLSLLNFTYLYIILL